MSEMEYLKINNIYQIALPSTSLRSKPNNFSNLETECLFGEVVKVIKIDKKWLKCKLLTDGYVGWIQKQSIHKIIETNYRIITPRTFIYLEPNAKSNVIFELSLGALINVIQYNNDWVKIYLDDTNANIGYIPKNHITKKSDINHDWVSVAESMINTPYKWGGRDSKGIDCSALVQLSIQTKSIEFPRNTSEQRNLHYPTIDNFEELERGMLIFWDGHVAVSIDNRNIIHSNAHHMKTVIEPFILANKRILKKESKSIKILDLRNI